MDETMADLTDEKLIELWHDTRSIIVLARELGITSYVLGAHWQRLRGLNLLPEGKRPVAYSARQVEPDDGHAPLFYQDLLLEKLIELYGAPSPQKKK
jgi:hypothetical protein